MIRIIIISICFFSAFFHSCSEERGLISDFRTGQVVDLSNGEISHADLDYRIKVFKKNGKNRDLFDYIYFQGDNICFSFKFSKRIDKGKINVRFSDPSGAWTFPSERTEFKDNRCYGFSLLGTLLEKQFSSHLDTPLSKEMFCCRKITFNIVIEVVEEKILRKFTFSRNFSIRYF